jgi:type I restriction enzyme S subunit
VKAVPVTSLNELVEAGVIQLTRGKVISKKDIEAFPGNFPVYSSAKENEGKFGEYGRYMFDEELITWSVDGGGRLFHRPKHKFSVTNVGGLLRIHDRALLDYKYLYYALTLRHSEVTFDWVKKAHPSIIKKLYRNIPLPSLPEQLRIVGILGEVFDGVATAKANADKNLHNARALFESYLQSVFIKGGEAWVETTLGVAYDVRDGTHDSPQYQSTGYPLITSKNLKREGLSFEEVKLISEQNYNKINERSTVHRGDVLFAMIGTIGNPILVTVEPRFAIKNVALFKIPRTQSGAFLRYYLASGSVSSKMMSEAKGTTQKFVGLGYLRSFPVKLPTLATQITTVKKLDEMAEETQRLESLYKRKLAALEALKKSLLHQAFTGNL